MNKNNITKEQYEAMQQMLKNAKDVTCPCGCDIFGQATKLKTLSKFITGENEDAILPIPPVFYCIKCLKEVNLEKEEEIIKKDEIVLDFKLKSPLEQRYNNEQGS